MLILVLILIVLALVILIANIAIVPQAYSYVVERLGVYYTTWEAGFHFKTPFVTRIAKKVSLKEQVVDFKPQPVITRDNVTMQIDTVVFAVRASCAPRAKRRAPSLWPKAKKKALSCVPTPCASSASARPKVKHRR